MHKSAICDRSTGEMAFSSLDWMLCTYVQRFLLNGHSNEGLLEGDTISASWMVIQHAPWIFLSIIKRRIYGMLLSYVVVEIPTIGPCVFSMDRTNELDMMVLFEVTLRYFFSPLSGVKNMMFLRTTV